MDAFSGMWEDRESCEKICRQEIERWQARLADYQRQKETGGDEALNVLIEGAEGQLESWTNNLARAQKGMLPPISAVGDYKHFSALASGELIDISGPSFDHSEADDGFAGAVADHPCECSYGKSNLARGKEIIEQLIGQGVDAALVGTLADYMFSAGRYRERVAVADFDSYVFAESGRRRAASSNAQSLNECHTELHKHYQGEVDALVNGGLSYTKATEQVASKYMVSPRTVQNHTENKKPRHGSRHTKRE